MAAFRSPSPVEHDAEGEQIRAAVQLLSPHLFGRHVGHGSQSHPRASKLFFVDKGYCLRRLRRDRTYKALRKEALRQTKIEYLA